VSLLVVEPDSDLLDLQLFMLRRAGYEGIAARDGAAALRLWQSKRPQLILLEAQLPLLDGWEVCEAVRTVDETPIIFVSETQTDAAVVRALGSGADDYVAKPFSPKQLLARIEAVLRRATAKEIRQRSATEVVKAGDLVLEPQWRRVRRGLEEIRLTGTEFKLLHELVLHEGQVLSHQVLADRVWGYDDVEDAGPLKGHIRNLRRKIEPEPDGKPIYIQTIMGVGYTFCSKPVLADAEPLRLHPDYAES
jgi:two-component system, OmpR family, response regulator VicR